MCIRALRRAVLVFGSRSCSRCSADTNDDADDDYEIMRMIVLISAVAILRCETQEYLGHGRKMVLPDRCDSSRLFFNLQFYADALISLCLSVFFNLALVFLHVLATGISLRLQELPGCLFKVRYEPRRKNRGERRSSRKSSALAVKWPFRRELTKLLTLDGGGVLWPHGLGLCLLVQSRLVAYRQHVVSVRRAYFSLRTSRFTA